VAPERELRTRAIHEHSSLTVVRPDAPFIRRSARPLPPWPRPLPTVSPLAIILRTPVDRVVVGIDAFEASVLALRWAAEEAWHRHVKLQVVHAVPQLPYPLDMVKVRALARRLVRSQLDAVAARMTTAGGASDITRELRDASCTCGRAPDSSFVSWDVVVGRPVDVLLRPSGKSPKALVVVGDRGFGNGDDTKKAIRVMAGKPRPPAVSGLVIVPTACFSKPTACPGCWSTSKCPGVCKYCTATYAIAQDGSQN
jgi:hypothetical protein